MVQGFLPYNTRQLDWNNGITNPVNPYAAGIAQGLQQGQQSPLWNTPAPQTTAGVAGTIASGLGAGAETTKPMAWSNIGQGTAQPSAATPNATGYASATAQRIAENTSTPWSAKTSGYTGQGYNNLTVAGFDPWKNLGQYNGGVYQDDGQEKWQIAGGSGKESDMNRVFRWTNDIAHSMGYADGSQLPPQLRSQIFLANVERLKGDYQQNGLDWNTSSLSHMQGVEAGEKGYVAPGTPAVNTAAPRTTPQMTPNAQNPAVGNNTPGATSPTSTGVPAATNPGAAMPSGGGGLNANQLGMLGDDPNQAYRYMMQQLGYNPDAPGLLSKYMQKKFQPLLEARMAAANLNGQSGGATYLDNLGNTINSFGQGLSQQGGNFYGNLAAIGQQATQQATPYLNSLSDQGQAIQYLNQMATLQYSGSNPLVQQSTADQLANAKNAYQDQDFYQGAGIFKNVDPYQQWLAQSQYRSIYGY